MGQSIRRQLGAATLIATLCSGVASCGYTLAGSGAFLPEYIETIAIPVFENLSLIHI